MMEWNPALSSYELDFGEDLNGDEILVLMLKHILCYFGYSNSTGTRLKKDTNEELYIDDAGTELKIVDEWGGSPSIEYTSEWDQQLLWQLKRNRTDFC